MKGRAIPLILLALTAPGFAAEVVSPTVQPLEGKLRAKDWQQFAVDECLIFQDGDVVFRDTPSKKTYLSIEEGIALARSVGASV